MINMLREAQFNDLPDSLFEMPMAKDVRLHDLQDKVTFTTVILEKH